MPEIPDPSNPYAPPTAVESAAVVHEMWRVGEGNLWVKRGAQIPGVDLATGELLPTGGVMRKLTLHVLGVAFLVQMVLMMAAFGVAGFVERHYRIHISGIWVILGVGVLFRLFGNQMGRTPFTVVYWEGWKKARQRRRIWMGVVLLAVGMFASIMVPIYLRLPSLPVPLMIGSAVAFLVAMLVLAIVGSIKSSNPRAGEVSGEWMRLKGVSPEAIAYLATLPGSAHGPIDPDRRSHLVHWFKFPLLSWCHVLNWKPGLCLKVALTKLTGAGGSTRSVLCLRPTFVAGELLSEEIRGRVAELRQELAAEWTFASWDQVKVPDQFSTLAETALFLHHSRRDVLIVSKVRSGASPVVWNHVLHAWLPDGTILRTSDERAFPMMNPAVEWDTDPEASYASLISKHLQKSESRGAILLAGREDAAQRLVQLGLDNHRWLAAKKIFGPLEEMCS